MSDTLKELLSVLGDWARSLSGFLILCGVAAIAWLGKLGISHLVRQVRLNRELREKENAALKKNIVELHRLLNIERLECRETSLIDARIQSSLLALASRYQILVAATSSGKRQTPPEYEDLTKELRELRQRMHDETNRRAVRVLETRRELKLPEIT